MNRTHLKRGFRKYFFSPSFKCGNTYTLYVNSNGDAYASGKNQYGSLGNGTDVGSKIIPQPITLLQKENIVQVETFFYTSFFLTNIGEVYACGCNNDHETGIGGTKNILKPTIVAGGIKDKRIVYIATGDYSTFFLGDNGDVYACGQNGDGELGVGDKKNRETPVFVKSLSKGGTLNINVDYMKIGQFHSIVLDKNGDIWGAGKSSSYQSGFKNNTGTLTHKKVNLGNKKVKWLSVGWDHNIVTTECGDVVMFGDNCYGQLGLKKSPYGGFKPTVVDKSKFGNKIIEKVFAESNFSFFIANDGTLFGCGNNCGQYGSDGALEKKEIVEITLFRTAGIFTKPIFISGASEHACFLMEDRKLYGVTMHNSRSYKSGAIGKIGKGTKRIGKVSCVNEIMEIDMKERFEVLTVLRDKYIDIIVVVC